MSKQTELPMAEDDMEKTTFEESLEKIRTIVTELEGGELSLESSIEKFREGSALLDHSRKLIADAEMRVKVLTEEEVESDNG